MTGGIRILSVCTHNRTRSVMTGALLTRRGEAAGVPLHVATAGFREAGLEPTAGTIDILGRHGLDVADHRSDVVTPELAADADLILTAEKQHVVTVAALGPGLFERTFTLPEFVRVGRRIGPRQAMPLPAWLGELAADRPRGLEYLGAEVDEIDDPTGQRPAEWRRAYDTISRLVDEAVALLG